MPQEEGPLTPLGRSLPSVGEAQHLPAIHLGTWTRWVPRDKMAFRTRLTAPGQARPQPVKGTGLFGLPDPTLNKLVAVLRLPGASNSQPSVPCPLIGPFATVM